MSFKSLFSVVLLIGLTGCTALNDKAEQLADKGARYSVQQNIGKSYAVVASQRDFTLERNPIIGKHIGTQALEDGRIIYFHRQRQEATGSQSQFGSFGKSEQRVRYDDFAYLVSTEGTIIDFAHKRSNAVYEQTEIGKGFFGVEIAGDEKKATDVTELTNFVTSSGASISSWYQSNQQG